MQYESRICKTGDEGHDQIVLKMRFQSDACDTTLVDVNMGEYWPCFGYGSFEWYGFQKPVLTNKLKEMGFDHKQAAEVVENLFWKLRGAFEQSSCYGNPWHLYVEYLFEEEVDWGSA